MDKNEITHFVHLAQGRIRLSDMINLLQDLDKWTIIIGDNHQDIAGAIKHLQSLESSITERMVIFAERNVSEQE